MSLEDMFNGDKIKAYEDFKKLNDSEQTYFIFMQIGRVHDKLNDITEKHAQKWVETVVKGFIGMILIGFAGAIIRIVL